MTIAVSDQHRRRPIIHTSVAFGCVALLVLVALRAPTAQDGKGAEDNRGLLKLTIVDGDSGLPTPARVELLDDKGKGHIAEDALLVGGDCKDRPVAWKGTLEEWKSLLTNKVANPQTGTDQFYAGGSCRLALAPGKYGLKVFKGTEYRVASQEVRIAAGGATELTVKMMRWIDLPREGWYSADSHMHIARPYKELNQLLVPWMQAEDIHFSTLLQWGNSRVFHNTAQYAMGPDGMFGEGAYFLGSGQENPRTSILGHTIVLGGTTPINHPDHYLVYKRFWEDAKKQGGLSGRAHFGQVSGGLTPNVNAAGMAIDLPDNLLSFIEVVQFDKAGYDNWYDALTMGFRLTPIAGTDFPCTNLRILPGRERSFAHIEGPLSYQAWLESVRRGKTFVSNGPAIDFHVSGKGPGEEITLKEAGAVEVDARVRFDADRDDVQVLEFVANGEVVRRFPRAEKATEIRCQFRHPVTEAAWLAVRVSGTKVGERPHLRYKSIAPSLAHSGAIYIMLEKAPGLGAQRRAKVVATKWAEMLEDMEKRLDRDRLQELIRSPFPSDSVALEYLKAHRDELLERVQTARKWYRDMAR